MNKLYDIIRLVMTSTLSDRDIAVAQRVAKNMVRRYRMIAAEGGYQWEQLLALDPPALEAAFNKSMRRLTQKRLPDFAWIQQELQGKSVTLLLLWEEYRAAKPDDALSYSQFTFHYRQFVHTVSLTMRQSHRPGERVFVDFSGKRPCYIDRQTGEQIPVELFLGATGYAHYIYAVAVPTQTLPDWILTHASMFEFFGGVPQAIAAR